MKSIAKKSIGIKLAVLVKRLGGALLRNWRRIVYYLGVAVVLCAVALAAEQYRKDPEYSELVLPAADISLAGAEEKAFSAILPDGMEVIREFSDEAVWNDELGQWEIHEATDFSAEEDEICAVSDGSVRAVGCDVSSGNYIEIESGNMLIRYASARALDSIAPGDWIEAGSVIAEADMSMPSEQFMGAHLHLELTCDEKSVNIREHFMSDAEISSNS